jgi:hypothetical protein
MTDTYTPAQVAERMGGIAEDRVRKIVRRECESLVPDELRMVPGGRVDDKVMVIYSGIFDAVTSGRAVTRTAPIPQMLRSIHDARKVG